MITRSGPGRLSCLVVLSLLWGTARPLPAQAPCGGGGDYQLGVNPAAVSIAIPEIQDLDAGQTLTQSVRIRVQPRGRGNRDWKLCIRSQDVTLGGQSKPVTDVEWQLQGSGTWQSLSTGDRIMHQGRGNENVNVVLRVRVDWSDEPADYGTLLTFSAGRS